MTKTVVVADDEQMKIMEIFARGFQIVDDVMKGITESELTSWWYEFL